MEAIEPISDFIDFPAKEEVLARLRAVDDSSEQLEELYEGIAERLAARTYERSASAFILIEIIYDFEEAHGSDMSYLLPRYVLTLTGDRDLALSALGAFNEIKDAIRLQQPEKDKAPEPEVGAGWGPAAGGEPEKAQPEETEPEEQGEEAIEEENAAPSTAPTPSPTSALDQMMTKLQSAQKTMADLGLSTRVSIDLTTRRPGRERVSRTLQDIASLRAALRRFEELLSDAELQVLEAAGVLWDDESLNRER